MTPESNIISDTNVGGENGGKLHWKAGPFWDDKDTLEGQAVVDGPANVDFVVDASRACQLPQPVN